MVWVASQERVLIVALSVRDSVADYVRDIILDIISTAATLTVTK